MSSRISLPLPLGASMTILPGFWVVLLRSPGLPSTVPIGTNLPTQLCIANVSLSIKYFTLGLFPKKWMHQNINTEQTLCVTDVGVSPKPGEAHSINLNFNFRNHGTEYRRAQLLCNLWQVFLLRGHRLDLYFRLVIGKVTLKPGEMPLFCSM